MAWHTHQPLRNSPIGPIGPPTADAASVPGEEDPPLHVLPEEVQELMAEVDVLTDRQVLVGRPGSRR